MSVKSRRRAGRKTRTSGAITQPPWNPLHYKGPPISILTDDQIESIHDAALTILQEIGMTVLAPVAREKFGSAGFDVDQGSGRVRFAADGVESLVSKAPSCFTLHARNPAKNIKIGDGYAAFSSVGGPAYVMDSDQGRRNGTYVEMCDFLRLVQSLDILHQEGGGGFEALDLPAHSRHLDLYYAQCTLLDKNWQPWGIGRGQAMDAIEMAAIMLGKTPESLIDTPVFSCVINTNSPLQLDIPMAEGLMAMAEYGQAVIVTPFTLSGAMSPVTLAGALAQQHAEAMAGIALAQIVRPGTPVLYGGFTSNVDMKTGSPAFGTPEYVQAAQASGQLARRLGVPFRSSNVTTANCPDAQAAYESSMSLWGAITGQSNLIMHAAGWLHGGLTASLEKLIIDAEMLQMMSAYTEPFEVNADTLALDAIREVGPAGHFFGAAHTLERYENAFYTPLLSNWDNYESWLERGSVNSEQRANEIWKQLLREYQQPSIDPAIDEALKDYVVRRKSEMPA
ncbi:MAG: trimethylamine methyltransferase family protein [Gammaproteobacteria bacterium]